MCTEFPAETEDAYNYQQYGSTAQWLKQAGEKVTAEADGDDDDDDDDEVKFSVKKRKAAAASEPTKRDKVCIT